MASVRKLKSSAGKSSPEPEQRVVPLSADALQNGEPEYARGSCAKNETDHALSHSAFPPHRSRIATIPPGYSSGLVSIFLEPQYVHFIRFPASGTG
jgi:phosphatidylserine decarboxylase